MLDHIATIEAAELRGGQLVISAHGPLDERSVGDLRDTLIPIAGADGAVVVLDLADAYGLDDATFAIVGRAAHLAAGRGGQLAIITHSPGVRRLVETHGLGTVVALHTTLKAAIE